MRHSRFESRLLCFVGLLVLPDRVMDTIGNASWWPIFPQVLDHFPGSLLNLVPGLILGSGVLWFADEERIGRLADFSFDCARWMLAGSMFWYGIAKIAGTQFAPTTYSVMETTLRELPSMDLTWAYYGSERVYASILGLFELIPALLLLSRRTVLLGSLLLLPVMINVVLVNYFYDIFVLYHATKLTLIVVFLVAYHRPLLQEVAQTVWNQPISRKTGGKALRYTFGAIVFISVVHIGSVTLYAGTNGTRNVTQNSPIEGPWEVVEGTSDWEGEWLTPASSWEKVFVERWKAERFWEVPGNLSAIRTDSLGVTWTAIEVPQAGLLRFHDRTGALTLEGTYSLDADTLRITLGGEYGTGSLTLVKLHRAERRRFVPRS